MENKCLTSVGNEKNKYNENNYVTKYYNFKQKNKNKNHDTQIIVNLLALQICI